MKSLNVENQRILISLFFSLEEDQQIDAGRHMIASDPVADDYYSHLSKCLKIWDSSQEYLRPNLDLFVSRIVRYSKPDKDDVILFDDIRNLEIYRIARKYVYRIGRFLCKYCLHNDVAEDVLCEVFCQLYKTVKKKNESDHSFNVHVFKIAAKEAKKVIEKIQDRSSLEPEILSEANDSFIHEVADVLAGYDTTAINQTIPSLPPTFRGILDLAYHEDFSYDDIANIMDMSRGQVKVYLNRAVNLLIACYRKK